MYLLSENLAVDEEIVEGHLLLEFPDNELLFNEESDQYHRLQEFVADEPQFDYVDGEQQFDYHDRNYGEQLYCFL